MRSRTNSRKKQKQSTILNKDGGSFTMPGRFKVTVQILDKKEARDEMDSQALAQYYQAEHVIVLRKTRSQRKRKSDLEHELQHACVDWVDHFMRKAWVVGGHTKG